MGSGPTTRAAEQGGEPRRPGRLALADYVAGVRAGDRATLARAITLVESELPRDRELAHALLDAIYPATGGAHRVGVTGVPGVGKSTFIEAIGTYLTGHGHKVAVLAVDPSSTRTGGSILGDKTRMPRLARDPAAFVRPSPTHGALGGVARHTREAMLLCEAAGFDVALIETVGVGQSEVVVAELVDTFVALMLAGAGDELQGIKRGLLEVVDLLVIHKADGENLGPARAAQAEYRSALRLLRGREAREVPVLACSSLPDANAAGGAVADVWRAIVEHRAQAERSGALARRRREQRGRALWRAIEDELRARFREHPTVAARLPALEAAVAAGQTSPERAAEALLSAFASAGEGADEPRPA
ncbi:MAG: methylmalonyl Co-A mutase-associated GTPase MeaB [Myxococcales bacterium]|nr:methylmalonyl Co-A mutase-associated GTPase MeaB [Myxococcales bacterium]